MYAVKKMHRPVDRKLPAVGSPTSVYQILFSTVYLLAIAIATLGWLWLLGWCTMGLMT
jgi:hypothetical protein